MVQGFLIRDIRTTVIRAELLTGTHRGSMVFIPRISLSPSDGSAAIQFSRYQFPIRPAFAMTINKAQGQTFERVGLDLLSSECFSHGQLYVALSRVTHPKNLFILQNNIYNSPHEIGTRANNVVYSEALL